MKVTYLHGLESKQGGPKVDWLKSRFGEVWAPEMNYRENPGLFEEVLSGIEGTDLIIGSSMGGWFAYLLITHTGTPTILFNPAVVDRSIDFDLAAGSCSAKHSVIQGEDDTTIDPPRAREWFEENGIGDFVLDTYPGGHRVPYEIFVEKVTRYRPADDEGYSVRASPSSAR